MTLIWFVKLAQKPVCPRCGYLRVVKSGHARSNQRWLCRRCGSQFTRLTGPGVDGEIPELTKRAAVTLYGHGLSFRAVGRLLGTTAQSVLRWVIGYVDHHCAKPAPEPVNVIEIDEMWHYLGRKARKLWIWKAYDRDRGRLFERIGQWRPRLICTDHFPSYEKVLAAGRHYQDKDQTVALERNNGRQRHWVGACRRKPIIVSKTKAMLERRVVLFAHLHGDGDAPPEMRTLPGAIIGRKTLA